MSSKVALRNEPYTRFFVRLAKIRTLVDGTQSMRDAGETYLPKYTGEEKEGWETRRDASTLFNGTGKTINDMAARVFEKPTVLSDDSNEDAKLWSANIDLEGRDLNAFAKDVFIAGLEAGIHYLFVDSPPKGSSETKADQIAMNARPYIKEIKPEDFLGWSTTTINNATVLSQTRVMERVEMPDGEFSSKTIEQVRVINLVMTEADNPVVINLKVRLYRKNDTTGEWEQFENDTFIDLKEIPIVPFYTNRVSYFKGKPVLEDLADINIAHWQSSSDQRNILKWCRVPILFASGLSADSTIKIAASTMIKASDPNAKLVYIEHSGAAIGAGQKDLEHLEFQMETFGLQLLTNDGTPQTATGEIRNDKKENSRLGSMVDSLDDALTKCFSLMGDLQNNVDFKVDVVIHKDFAAGLISQTVLSVLLTSVNNNKISRLTFWSEMKRLGVLSEKFDSDIEVELLDKEAAEAAVLFAEAGFDDDEDG